MIAQARQSVTKWISHLSLPHEGTSFMFFFPNQGNHMLKTLPKQHNPHCKVKCWETEVSFPLVLTLSSSLHDCCLLACGQWGCSQISQDHRDARVCCPRGCSCQLLHKPEGRQGAGKGGRRIKAHLKAPWATASQPFFCHRHILWTKGFMGSFYLHTPHLPPTLAPPDIVLLASPNWHQLLAAHIQCFLPVHVQTGQTHKIYRKMPFGTLIVLYSNAAL